METQVNRIEPQSGKFPQAVIWIAGIALTLFCAVGIAAFMGWIPNSMGGPSDKTAVDQQSANTVPAVPPKAHKGMQKAAPCEQEWNDEGGLVGSKKQPVEPRAKNLGRMCAGAQSRWNSKGTIPLMRGRSPKRGADAPGSE